jgi:hypothetical protein
MAVRTIGRARRVRVRISVRVVSSLWLTLDFGECLSSNMMRGKGIKIVFYERMTFWRCY